MRRMFLLTALLFIVDQASRWAAQLLLEGRRYLLMENLGVTYVTNPGLWIWPEAPAAGVWALSLLILPSAVVLLAGARRYRKVYRRSLMVDAAVAFLLLALLGNPLDRLMMGYVRDWFVTPIAVANLADMAEWPALVLIGLELWTHPPARALLSVDPRRWWQPQGAPPPTRSDVLTGPKRDAPCEE